MAPPAADRHASAAKIAPILFKPFDLWSIFAVWRDSFRSPGESGTDSLPVVSSAIALVADVFGEGRVSPAAGGNP
jgi:uncharacterized membrane protein YtjA (UPF0391 family)